MKETNFKDDRLNVCNPPMTAFHIWNKFWGFGLATNVKISGLGFQEIQQKSFPSWEYKIKIGRKLSLWIYLEISPILHQ